MFMRVFASIRVEHGSCYESAGARPELAPGDEIAANKNHLMAMNRLPDALNELLFLAAQAHAGAAALGAEIPLLINTAPLIAADRTNVLGAEAQFGAQRAALPALFASLKDARAEARDFCLVARDWLKNFLGRRHNQAWRAAGWNNNSIAVPERDAAVDSILESLQRYLTEHAEQECAALNVTAARAGALYGALSGAIQALNAAQPEILEGRRTRDAAVEQLRARLRGLRGELQQRLSADDARWRQFGFNIPAANAVPAVPQDVSVNTQTPGTLWVQCAKSAHATHYRFFTQRAGVDAVPAFAGRSTEPLIELRGLPPGVALEIFVTAVNDGAESAFSKAVPVVVGGPLRAAAA
jgi:hypothetical protein